MHRFFLTGPVAEDGRLPLVAEDIHHLRDVVRLAPGDVLVAVEPGGRAREVRLTAVAEGAVFATVTREVPSPNVPRTVLVQGLAKGEKMDLVVRQATELGVERIVPLQSARAVVRLNAHKSAERVARWARIAAEAAKQSQRDRVPVIAPVTTSGGLAAALGDSALVLLAWEEETQALSIAEAVAAAGLDSDSAVAVIVGPEGGFALDEVRAMERMGATVVSLGPTVLRTETAGVVAVALAMAARGGLGGPLR